MCSLRWNVLAYSCTTRNPGPFLPDKNLESTGWVCMATSVTLMDRRRNRTFNIALAVTSIALVFAGFARTYYLNGYFSHRTLTWFLHAAKIKPCRWRNHVRVRWPKQPFREKIRAQAAKKDAIYDTRTE